MATYGRTMRRGLPRRTGGEPWPPEGVVPAGAFDDSGPGPSASAAAGDVVGSAAVSESGTAAKAAAGQPDTGEAPAASAAAPVELTSAGEAKTTTPSGGARAVRRGLPRVPGGEPWPPAVGVPATRSAASEVHATAQSDGEGPAAPAAVPAPVAAAPVAPAPVAAGPERAASTTASPEGLPQPEAPARSAKTPAAGPTRLLRRGLPREPGGELWPAETEVLIKPVPTPEGAGPKPSKPAGESTAAAVASPSTKAEPELREAATVPKPSSADATDASEAEAPSSSAATAKPAASLPSGAAQESQSRKPAAKVAKERSRRTNLILGALGLLLVALAAVFFTRWFVTLGFMQDFLATYPGETHLPEGAQSGFPAWVQWQHFFNFFLIVLIIRSGLQVRRETRPPGYWTPKWAKGGDGKISINLWFHQALDILWLLNGLVFVVLLFVTGHWMRLVPTTWEVFPNALSAAIQYVSLDWPTENGWVNYNSLQMLAYFLTIFVAAPLAALSGARMSGIWPKNATALNRAYPVEWARAVHFPVMLYFVFFIITHVALVFATGALRNLNHMYGGQDVVNWAGFWIFFVSLLLVIGAWFAARPLMLAPIAGLFGRVSSR